MRGVQGESDNHPNLSSLTRRITQAFWRKVRNKSPFHHQFKKPELVSGFFTSAVCASSGRTSRICLASVTPRISPFWALHGLSVLGFYLPASRACARLLLELMRVSGLSVVVGNSCSGGDRSLPLHQVQASENACFTLEPVGWPIHPARPVRTFARGTESGRNAPPNRRRDLT